MLRDTYHSIQTTSFRAMDKKRPAGKRFRKKSSRLYAQLGNHKFGCGNSLSILLIKELREVLA